MQPDFAIAGLNLAESLDAAAQRTEAIDVARHESWRDCTASRSSMRPASRSHALVLKVSSRFHVDWEQAAWKTAGQPQAEARAKPLTLDFREAPRVAGPVDRTNCRHYYREAVLRQPDPPLGRALLGDALSRADRPQDALEHLREGLMRNPLDGDAARACFHILGTVKDADGRRRLREDRRLLAQAAPHVVPIENWFAEARPKGNELASIIVLACRPSGRTRHCVDNLLRHTRRPFELGFIARGSDNLTPEYLEEIRNRTGPERVEVIYDVADQGNARVCNQAAPAKTRGRYVVFLDADSVVTPGWLDCLVALSLHEWPHVGLVGPVTNAALGPQGVRVDFQELEKVNGFAAERRRTWSGQMSVVGQLGSFCVLARREILDRLSGLDEQFSLNLFAISDLCLRAREAGSRLLLAQDVYVHRTGGDIGEFGQQDFELFKAKWGSVLATTFQPSRGEKEKPIAASETVPAEPAAHDELRTINSEGISLCMIVKNEEANLPECLRTVQGLFDEIVVVDTGSADQTREAARKYGAKVYEFPWVDSFAVARNESVRHATGKWIMWLDADDRLDDENRERLRKVFAGLGDEHDAYAITVRSVLDASRTTFRLLDQVRIFRNLPEIRWDYRIHEQILPAVNRAGGVVRWTDAVVDHVGYQDASLRHRKLERNLRLLELDGAERSDDSFSLFNLGWTMLGSGLSNT